MHSINCYRKQQILCSTKLSRFTDFLAECRKNCRGFVKLQYIVERAIEISRENFCVLSKITKTAKVLYCGGFVVCGILWVLIDHDQFSQPPDMVYFTWCLSAKRLVSLYRLRCYIGQYCYRLWSDQPARKWAVFTFPVSVSEIFLSLKQSKNKVNKLIVMIYYIDWRCCLQDYKQTKVQDPADHSNNSHHIHFVFNLIMIWFYLWIQLYERIYI